MASTKVMQLRAKAKKIAAESSKKTYKLPTINVGKMSAVSFTAVGEVTKMFKECKNSPLPFPTRSNQEDLKAMPYDNSDAGFFVALVPVAKNTTHAGVMANDRVKAAEIMEHFTLVKFNEKLGMLSTYCTWDYAQKHFKDITDTLEYAVVGFSTPEQMQILAENPSNI